MEYRLMRLEDEDQVVSLWAYTFGSNDPERARTYIRATDPDYLSHTLLAVADDNTVMATLHYYAYELRGVNGTPQLVGCISHVATREEGRRQGHASKLLQWAFEAMRAEGCAWTLLFSSTMGVPLYEKHGFRHYPQPYRRGLLLEPPPASDSYAINQVGQSDTGYDFSQLEPLFDAYNANRPLIHLRNDWYWRVFFPFKCFRRFETDSSPLYTATAPDGTLCGYMLAYTMPPEQARERFELDRMLTVGELCVLPGHHSAIIALWSAASANVGEGSAGGRLFLPYEQHIDEAASLIFGPTLTEHDERKMYARPLSPDVTHDDIQAIFTAPGATYWPIDDF